VTNAERGLENAVLIAVDCGVPAVAEIWAGAPAVFVRAKVAPVTVPALALTRYDPTIVFAVNPIEAMPAAFVTAVLMPPLNVPLGPDAGALNVTVTPGTPVPDESVTRADSDVAKAVPTVALCGVPPAADTFAGAWATLTTSIFELALFVPSPADA
jgi:hypothetical protein